MTEAPPVRTVTVVAYSNVITDIASRPAPDARRGVALIFYDDNGEMHPVVFTATTSALAVAKAEMWWAKEIEEAKRKWTARAIAIAAGREKRAAKALARQEVSS